MASERTVFVNTSLTVEARTGLQGRTARLQAETGQRRMSMSAALEAMSVVVDRHWSEVVEAARGQGPTD